MKIAISSIDKYWFNALQCSDSFAFRVHSWFDRVINLEDREGQFIYVFIYDLGSRGC